MRTAQIYQPPHLIDTAPLVARYNYINEAILAFIAAGHMLLVVRYTYKLLQVIRAYARFDGANIMMRLKLDMLCNRAWRQAVLRDLGGLETLRRWEAIAARFVPRQDRSEFKNKPSASLKGYGPVDENPSWLLTPERIAESERLKARARTIMRACASPNIVRDRVKMDFDGLFRLPPLPRQEKLPANTKIYTEASIIDYDWNSMPLNKETGFGPAMVWPHEFYAAMVLDGEMEEEVPVHNSAIPQEEHSEKPLDTGPNAKDSAELSGPAYAPVLCKQNHKLLRDDKGEREENREDTIEGIPLLPLSAALPPESYRALFENPV